MPNEMRITSTAYRHFYLNAMINLLGRQNSFTDVVSEFRTNGTHSIQNGSHYIRMMPQNVNHTHTHKRTAKTPIFTEMDFLFGLFSFWSFGTASN